VQTVGQNLVVSSIIVPVSGEIIWRFVGTATSENDLSFVAKASSPGVTSAQSSLTIPVGGAADVGVTISPSSGSLRDGITSQDYTITVFNNGPSGTVATVSNDPTQCTDYSWKCFGSSSQCPSTGTNSGPININLKLAVGASVQISTTCKLSSTGSDLLNTVSVGNTDSRVVDPVPGNNQASSRLTAATPACYQCPQGPCVSDQSLCNPCKSGETYCVSSAKCVTNPNDCSTSGLPPTNIGGDSGPATTINFDQSAGFSLGEGDTNVNLQFGDIKELDSEGRVVYAEHLSDQKYNITAALAYSVEGNLVLNVNFTATLANGAFFRVANFLFNKPDIYVVGSVDLVISGQTNKFSIIVADWPFEDFDVHSLQIDILFAAGNGEAANNPCLVEQGTGDKKVTVSTFQAAGGIVAVQVLQFATIDGVETRVSAILNSTTLQLTTPAFFIDMIYDPDFSILLGGSSTGGVGGGCLGTDKPLLYASIAALVGASVFAFVFIIVFIFFDIKKKKRLKAEKLRRQAAYKSGMATDSINGEAW